MSTNRRQAIRQVELDGKGVPTLIGDVDTFDLGIHGNIQDLRALNGVLENDAALMSGLIIMEPLGPTKNRNFGRYMAEAGTRDILGIEYPRMQILTVGEILEGNRFMTPTVSGCHELEPRFPEFRLNT